MITKPKDLQRAAGGHSGRDVICRLCNTPALEESSLALDASCIGECVSAVRRLNQNGNGTKEEQARCL